MSETKFKKSIRELDFNQAKLDIEKGDRFRIIRAIESLEIADEMYVMLESMIGAYESLYFEVYGDPIDKDEMEDEYKLLAKARETNS